MYSIVTVFILLAGQVNGQSELASLIGGTAGALAPNLLAGAAAANSGPVSSLLSDIGTLYQLAQGALQLTGTGVNIINQASEGKWFNAAIKEARQTNRELQERMLTGNGLEPDSSQFGINFAAPSPEDYDQEQSPKLESLVPMNVKSTVVPQTIPIEAPLITLFPEEKETNNPNKKESQNSGTKNHVIDATENEEEVDRFRNKEDPKRDDIKIFSNFDDEEQRDEKLKVDEEKVAKLKQFLVLLRKSNITENELNEMARILKEQKAIKSKQKSLTTECNIPFISPTVINTTTSVLHRTEEKSKSFITDDPSTRSRRLKLDVVTDSEDSDLLPSTNSRFRTRAGTTEYESSNQPQTNSTPKTYHPNMKFPRRTAYTARLPFVSRPNYIEKTIRPKQSEVNVKEGAFPEIHLIEPKPHVLGNQFLYPPVLNPFGRPEASSTTPIFGAFQVPSLLSRPQLQTTNAIESQSPYLSVFDGSNRNNGLWPYPSPLLVPEVSRLGHLNLNSNLNFKPPVLPFH
ncbi:unnamed protein product [Onchocerca ochengi]|uniref:Uncharacterized protein n=1 Tax=Onchocerca ochengi TaxID=42157 RepID=A0A182E5N1_ONCOC|nr:unnamed protein product [Onchocerca ochengi]